MPLHHLFVVRCSNDEFGSRVRSIRSVRSDSVYSIVITWHFKMISYRIYRSALGIGHVSHKLPPQISKCFTLVAPKNEVFCCSCRRNLSQRIKVSERIINGKALKMATTKYTTVEKGARNSTNYSLYFRNDQGNPISPLHDIPLFADDEKTIYNMVIEVPRWTNAKMEINLKQKLNPIKQDIKKGKLRFVANCFPHKGYIWNYGALPQTWENPDHIEPSTGCKGDNDPIDVVEIGYRVAKRGDVVQVKVLGCIALIDEGETDWKIIAINVNDPLASKMEDINDVDKYFPGLLRSTVEWFKIYKIPDGKPENVFAFNGDAKNAAFAKNIIMDTHKFWKGLIGKTIESTCITRANTTIADSPDLISVEDAEKVIDEAPDDGVVEDIDDSVDRWHFVHLK